MKVRGGTLRVCTLVNNQNLHIRTWGNTLHYSRINTYVLNRGQTKTNKIWVCMISMNDTEKLRLGYAFSQGNKTTWRYLCNLPNIWYITTFINISTKLSSNEYSSE